jgi:DNA-binding YbaB/EbfC family protein
MFKGLANVASLMKQAGELQSRMGEMKEQLARLQMDGRSHDGKVVVTAAGDHRVLSCRIDPSLVTEGNVTLIEKAVVEATNDAFEKIRQAAASQMSEMAGGMPDLTNAMSSLGLGK